MSAGVPISSRMSRQNTTVSTVSTVPKPAHSQTALPMKRRSSS